MAAFPWHAGCCSACCSLLFACTGKLLQRQEAHRCPWPCTGAVVVSWPCTRATTHCFAASNLLLQYMCMGYWHPFTGIQHMCCAHMERGIKRVVLCVHDPEQHCWTQKVGGTLLLRTCCRSTQSRSVQHPQTAAEQQGSEWHRSQQHVSDMSSSTFMQDCCGCCWWWWLWCFKPPKAGGALKH